MQAGDTENESREFRVCRAGVTTGDRGVGIGIWIVLGVGIVLG